MGRIPELYSPPDAAPVGGILARYRRPVARPLADAYVAAWSAPGDLVLDPFCQDATVLWAAAAAGRRALGVTGNPLLALLIRVEAAPPAAGQLAAALQQIHSAAKAGGMLGEELDRLYATACSHCGLQSAADAFVWERGEGRPLLREYRCPHCGHAGREPVPADETGHHSSEAAQGFHRRLVAERLRAEGAPPRLLERLLDLYTPRNLYVLTTLALKLDALYTTSPFLDPLRAALLHALDLSSKLHLATEEGWRPVGSLVPPRRFREANAWRAFVGAVQMVGAVGERPRFPILTSAADPAQVRLGSACLCMEPLGRLAARAAGQVALALSQLPRFDPTFAALSYLWSGWLLGRDGSRAAAHLLQQRAPGELRYLGALQVALAALRTSLTAEGRLALVFQAPATRFLESLLVAAGGAGLAPAYAWHGLLDDRPAAPQAVRRAEHHLALAPRAHVAPPADALTRAGATAVRAAMALLAARGEPAPFGALHGPIWVALAGAGLLDGRRAAPEAEALRRSLSEAVSRALAEAEGLRAEPLPGGEPDAALWRLAQPLAGVAPLADRTEALVRTALAGGPLSEADVQREALGRLPEGQVPAWPLVRACIESYGRLSDAGRWALASEEEGERTQTWREAMIETLRELGPRLGYEAGEAPGCDVAWLEAGAVRVACRVQADAELGGLGAMGRPAAGRRVLVMPERRVALWRHKLAAVPLWRIELVQAGWAFLRAGALVGLLEGAAERARFEAALGLEEGGSQLALFG